MTDTIIESLKKSDDPYVRTFWRIYELLKCEFESKDIEIKNIQLEAETHKFILEHFRHTQESHLKSFNVIHTHVKLEVKHNSILTPYTDCFKHENWCQRIINGEVI